MWNRDGVGEYDSWKDALLAVEARRPNIAGWKRRLREWPEMEATFDRGYERLQILAARVSSRRDVSHRDLVNRMS